MGKALLHQWNDVSEHDVLPSGRGSDEEIVIGIVNIRPFSARSNSEGEFSALLQSGIEGIKLSLRYFALDEDWTTGPARGQVRDLYEPISALWGERLDGLIVTGAEPRAAAIADEPILPQLRELVSWAGRNTVSSIFSCFAAHCAVWCIDGITRRRYDDKLFGVFSCEKAENHIVTENLPPHWPTPHSRYNTVDVSSLEDAGYRILSQAPHVGADLFAKEQGISEFLFFQGHPEYGPARLLSEYCRDVRRFHQGTLKQYPNFPENYGDETSRTAFMRLRQNPLEDVEARNLTDIEMVCANELNHAWHGVSRLLLSNWLHFIKLRRAHCSIAKL